MLLVMTTNNIPSVFSNSVSNYLEKVGTIPILTKVEEKKYVNLYLTFNNIQAAHILIKSHLKLVVSIAFKYKNYGIPIADLISEGNIGLMKAIKKFKPDKGTRLSTYAMWWIKSCIQEYIIKSWSIIKISSSILQKKLFSNNNHFRKKNTNSNSEYQYKISQTVSMNKNIGNTNIELSNIVSDIEPSVEDNYSIIQEKNNRYKILHKSLSILSNREKSIIKLRKLSETSVTLKTLSIKYNISSERVRQIENTAFNKIKKFILDNG